MPIIKSKLSREVKVTFKAGHRDKAGNLISNMKTRGRWFNYFFGKWDDKRVAYCEKHRHDHVPENFKEGEFSLSTILFTLKLMKRGEWDGL